MCHLTLVCIWCSQTNLVPSSLSTNAFLSSFQTSLPRNAFHALRHLSTLDVSNNTIVEIGSAFTDMPELKYLDLSYNHLPIVKRGAFRNLPSLVGLRLDYNSIIGLEEESFTDLLSLETLILTKNGISAIRRGTFRNLPSLEKLKLDENHMTIKYWVNENESLQKELEEARTNSRQLERAGDYSVGLGLL